MVKTKKYSKLIEEQCEIMKPYVQPLVDEVEKNLLETESDSLNEDELKKEKHQLTNFLYQKEVLFDIFRAIDVISENLPRIPGGGRVINSLHQVSLNTIAEDKVDWDQNAEEIAKALASFEKQCKTLSFVNTDKTEEETKENPIQQIIPFMDVLGISQEDFNAMYEIGNLLFNENHIKDAKAVFKFLCFLNVRNSSSWYSLGLCYQRLQNIPEAIANYSIAIVVNCTNIFSFLNLARCYATINDWGNVEYTLNIAEKILEMAHFTTEEKKQIKEEIIKIKKH